MKKRRNFAVIIFIAVLVFFAVETSVLFTAKSRHDYLRAKGSAEELSVELGLISSALSSGDKVLYEETLARYRATLSEFSNNAYSMYNQTELIASLRDFNDTLSQNKSEVGELLELSAALSAIRLELSESQPDVLDVKNFYHIQQTFQDLRDVLDGLKSENLAKAKGRLTSFADEVIKLASSSAVCVSVCPKNSFANKQKTLEGIKGRYEEEFKTLGLAASEKYDPSALILSLGSF